MCQFEYKDKKIKLLFLRTKIRQPDQTPPAFKKIKVINLNNMKVFDQNMKKRACPSPSLPLLSTPSPPPLVVALSFLLLACLLLSPYIPPLLPTPSHYIVPMFPSAFAFALHMHALYKEIIDGLEQSNINYKSEKILRLLMLAII